MVDDGDRPDAEGLPPLRDDTPVESYTYRTGGGRETVLTRALDNLRTLRLYRATRTSAHASIHLSMTSMNLIVAASIFAATFLAMVLIN